jgi:hypothetical protein
LTWTSDPKPMHYISVIAQYLFIFSIIAIIKTYRWQCEAETTSTTRLAKALITTLHP